LDAFKAVKNTFYILNTIVFSSSIFFIAFSVATGRNKMAYLSNPSLLFNVYLTDLAYFGVLASFKVLGL
jgi:hypothetical protein